MQALLAGSISLTICHAIMPQPASVFSVIVRFDPRPVLARLCLDEALFVLLDPTEILRPQARKTAYVAC